MKSPSFLALISVVSAAAIHQPAALQARCTDPPPDYSRGFTASASRTGSSIDTAALTASGLKISIHGNVSTYCPAGPVPDCQDYTTTLTVFACADYSGAATSCWMSATVPGGQQMYVDPSDGHLGYTQAHSSAMPPGALTTGFTYDHSAGRFSFVGNGAAGLVACPANPKCATHPKAKGCDPWSVRAALPELETQQKNCLRFGALTTDSNATAWQYT